VGNYPTFFVFPQTVLNFVALILVEINQMSTKKIDPKVRELKKKADRYIEWYIAQQQKEEITDKAEKKRIVNTVK